MAKENEFFDGLREAMTEGLAALKSGKALTTREVTLPEAPKPMSPGEIADLRKNKVGVSQVVFAKLTNTATQTVQAWEQGRTKPSGPALRLLRLIEDEPKILFHTLARDGKRRTSKACRDHRGAPAARGLPPTGRHSTGKKAL